MNCFFRSFENTDTHTHIYSSNISLHYHYQWIISHLSKHFQCLPLDDPNDAVDNDDGYIKETLVISTLFNNAQLAIFNLSLLILFASESLLLKQADMVP